MPMSSALLHPTYLVSMRPVHEMWAPEFVPSKTVMAGDGIRYSGTRPPKTYGLVRNIIASSKIIKPWLTDVMQEVLTDAVGWRMKWKRWTTCDLPQTVGILNWDSNGPFSLLRKILTWLECGTLVNEMLGRSAHSSPGDPMTSSLSYPREHLWVPKSVAPIYSATAQTIALLNARVGSVLTWINTSCPAFWPPMFRLSTSRTGN